MKQYKGSITEAVEKEVLKRVRAYRGDHAKFRREVVEATLKHFPTSNACSVRGAYTNALKKLRAEQPEAIAALPDFTRGSYGPRKKREQVAPRSTVRIRALREGDEFEQVAELPEDFGWDDMSEADRVRWTLDVALRGAVDDLDAVCFVGPGDAVIPLKFVCQMSISDLCLAQLHFVR